MPVIQSERIYLFETTVNDPYFIGEKNGVTTKFVNNDPRTIELLDIVTVFFFMEDISKGGLNYTQRYEGEDTGILYSHGKTEAEYSIEFNLPTFDQLTIEKMIGKQFSLLGMRRDLSHYVIFGQFQADPFSIDNEVQNRVTMSTGRTNAKILDVQSFSITNIENIINGSVNNFDLELDTLLS